MNVQSLLSRLLGVSVLFCFIGVLSFQACKHKPEPFDEDPNTQVRECHPDTVYFTRDVLPILVSSCAMSGCHDQNTAMDGVRLTDYQSVMQTADVSPGNPSGSDLYEVITEDDLDKRMPPPPSNPLSTDKIQLIYKWIMQGALNLECGDADCNLDNVTYSQTIVPIIGTYCLNCHTQSSSSGGVNLETYAGVAQVGNNGRLYGAVSHASGFSAMPPSGGKIPDCKIQQINKWINDGTPQN